MRIVERRLATVFAQWALDERCGDEPMCCVSARLDVIASRNLSTACLLVTSLPPKTACSRRIPSMPLRHQRKIVHGVGVLPSITGNARAAALRLIAPS